MPQSVPVVREPNGSLDVFQPKRDPLVPGKGRRFSEEAVEPGRGESGASPIFGPNKPKRRLGAEASGSGSLLVLRENGFWI